MSTQLSPNEVTERIGQLCSEFKLPTVGAEGGAMVHQSWPPRRPTDPAGGSGTRGRGSQTATYHPAQTCLQAARR